MAGHTDIAALHDTAREMLLEYRTELEHRWKAGYKSSNLKKVREQLNNLDLDPRSYADQLDNALSRNASAEEIMKLIRNHQSRTMKLWQVLSDDTIHHIVGKRTGGDSLAHIDGAVIREAVDRLVDEYGHRFANHHSNYNNFSEGEHKGQTPRKGGLEEASGVRNTDYRHLMAHPDGSTSKHARNLTPLEMQDVDSVVEALRGIINPQKEAADNADLLAKPRKDRVNELFGRDVYGAQNIAEQMDVKQLLKIETPNIQSELIDSYKLQGSNLKIKPSLGQSLSLDRKQLKMLAAAGLAAPSVLGTAASAAETKGRAELALKTKNPIDALQTGLSAASLAGDFVPVAGELISTPADAANLVIDGVRDREGAKIQRSLARSRELQVSGRDDAATRRNSLSVGFSQNSGF